MPLQTFPHLQDSTRLIRYQDTLYKVKILFTKMLQEKGVHNEELTEQMAHQEIEETFKAILYLLEKNSDFKTIATSNFCITPKLVPWAFRKIYKEYVFMQNGKVLKAFDQMFELHISEKFKHRSDVEQTYSVNQSHVDKSRDNVKISSGEKKVISCHEQRSNSSSVIEEADNTGKVYVQTMINLDNSELEAMPKFERTKDGRLCRIVSSNSIVKHSNETRPINKVKSNINPSLTKRKEQLSKKLKVKPSAENVSSSVKGVSELMNLSFKMPESVDSKKSRHAVRSNMDAANFKLLEKNQSSPYSLRERSTVSHCSTRSKYGPKQDVAVEPTSSYRMSLELDKQAMRKIVNDQKKTQREDEVKNNLPNESKKYQRYYKRQNENAFKSNVKAKTRNKQVCKERVSNSVLKGKKNLLRKSLRAGMSTRSSRKIQHHRMTESNCNEIGQTLNSENEPRRKKIRLSPGLINPKSTENYIHTESEIDSSSSPRRKLKGQNCNRNNSTVTLRSPTLEDGDLNSLQKLQEVCSPRISAVHPIKRANTCMPNTGSIPDSLSRANNSNTPPISSTRIIRQHPGDDAESLKIEQMRQNWPAHIIGMTKHSRDRYLVEQAERMETDKLRELYAPTMPRRSPRITAKDHSTQRRGSSGLWGRIVDTFFTPSKALMNCK